MSAKTGGSISMVSVVKSWILMKIVCAALSLGWSRDGASIWWKRPTVCVCVRTQLVFLLL